jgi:hypothetical protein
MRARRVIGRVLGLAGPLLITAAAVGPAALAEAMPARPAQGAVLAGTGVLDDVVAVGARDAWAVGHSGSLASPRTLVEHWNGAVWRRVSVRPAAGWLNGIAATSARDIWAVGFSGNKALILHFDGTAWRRVASPAVRAPQVVLADVTALSPHDAWAVGGTHSNTVIERWNGTAWRRLPSPSPQTGSFLEGVSAASAADVWAVGGSSKTLILHWNGARWRHVPSPSPGAGAHLFGVFAVSAGDAWAAGSSRAGALMLHWNGTAWRRARAPAVRSGAGLVALSGTSARNLWAAGATGSLIAASARPARLAAGPAGTEWPASAQAGPAAEPLILHWNGTAWRRARIPMPASGGMLIGVHAPSARSAWAVGCTKTFANINAKPLALHWNGIAWK